MVDLATAKAHCRIDSTDEDDLVTRHIAAATEYLCTIGVDATTAPVPAPVEAAMLLLVGHLYDNRETVVIGTIASELPMGFATLIAPYRGYVL